MQVVWIKTIGTIKIFTLFHKETGSIAVGDFELPIIMVFDFGSVYNEKGKRTNPKFSLFMKKHHIFYDFE